MIEVMAERDAIIDNLQEQLRESRNTIQTLHSENSYIQEQLRLKINEFESTIAELVSSFDLFSFDLVYGETGSNSEVFTCR